MYTIYRNTFGKGHQLENSIRSTWNNYNWKLSSDYNKFKDIIVTKSLVQDTWKFMSEHNISLLYDICTFLLQCIGGKILMDEFLSSSLKGKDLQAEFT
jgi:hypothetical protein